MYESWRMKESRSVEKIHTSEGNTLIIPIWESCFNATNHGHQNFNFHKSPPIDNRKYIYIVLIIELK